MNATTTEESRLPIEKGEPGRPIDTSPGLSPIVNSENPATTGTAAHSATVQVACQDPENPQPSQVVVVEPQHKLVERIAHTRFDPSNKPPDDPCVFGLAGVEIAHAGNLVTIAAAVKSGKSSVIAAMIASLMGEDPERDYLAFSGSNPDGKTVLHFDTEQSRGDHWRMGMRTIARAGLEVPPAWYQSYSLISLSPEERATVIGLMARQAVVSGGLHSIFIDGVADLILDVNDPEEACGLVTKLHQLATETGCVIVSAIHLNPSSEKARGHLGSQIYRKSESVLVLEKKGELISVSCQPARRQEISGDRAPQFSWDSLSSMHKLSKERPATKNDRKREALGILADEVFGEMKSMQWTDLKKAIMKARDWSGNTAGNRINEMVKLEVIKKRFDNSYLRCPEGPQGTQK
jgi:hypothetical protein